MTSPTTVAQGKAGRPLWTKIVAQYQTPDTRAALWQVATSIGLFLLFQALGAFSARYSVWLTLACAVLAAGFMMRTFIVLHDCGHGSFFKNQKWNDAFGVICGVLTYTPYFHWRHSHAIHHATSGDLDRRGIGDVPTLTVREYNALPWHRRLGYRVYRHPIVLFIIGAPLLFLVLHRFDYGDFPARERASVHWTTLAIAGLTAAMMALFGWREYLLVQIPIVWIGTVTGVWMFYLQHQFEETYWKPHPEWDYYQASLKGSSYYQLPKVLQWFTGNIGFHHIHHLSPKIPNYQLERCFRENPVFHDVSTLTLWSSFRTLGWRLWDEESQRLVGFARAAEVSRLEKRKAQQVQAQA